VSRPDKTTITIKKNTIKKIKPSSFFGLALILILASCSMEKRHYMSGYSISWKNDKHKSDKLEFVKNNTTNENKFENKKIESSLFAYSSGISENNITASKDNSIFINSTPKIDLFKNKDRNELQGILTASETKTIVKINSKQNKKKAKSDPIAEGKSQVVAFWICLFIGIVGIHYFYLGYTGVGIIRLLCFLIIASFIIPFAIAGILDFLSIFVIGMMLLNIFALIDLIRIITGSLKPKDGDYIKKL
jgi:hypothetical protein